MNIFDNHEVYAAADILSAVTHQLRLQIVLELENGEKNVKQLMDSLNTMQALVSQSLRILYNNGIVDKRKEGVRIFYRLLKKGLIPLVKCIKEREYDFSR